MIQEKAFIKHLKDNGYSQNTIAKYRHDLRLLKKFLGKRELSKENLVSFKDDLLKQYQAASINSIIACINSYLNYKGLYNLHLKRIKVQRKIFEDEKELIDLIYMINSKVNSSVNQTTRVTPNFLFQKEKEYLLPIPKENILEQYTKKTKNSRYFIK